MMCSKYCNCFSKLYKTENLQQNCNIIKYRRDFKLDYSWTRKVTINVHERCILITNHIQNKKNNLPHKWICESFQ